MMTSVLSSSAGGVAQSQNEMSTTSTSGGVGVGVTSDATASGISATPPDSESSSTSTLSGAGTPVVENVETPSTSLRQGGPLDNIADRMASLISNTEFAGLVAMSKDELKSCSDIEVLRQQSLSFRVQNEMLQIQNQLLDFERKSRFEAGSGIHGHGANDIDPATAMLAFKEDLYRKIISVLETEFNCCVCSETFIEPTVLECGHTFCGTCITQWLQEHRQCPVCRFTSFRPVKHVEMNNFITKIYLMLSDEIRQRRDQQVRDRQTQLADNARRAAATAAAQPPPAHSVTLSHSPFPITSFGYGTLPAQDFGTDRSTDRAAMYRRISDQVATAYGRRFALLGGRHHHHRVIPPQTARRGRHEAHISSGRERARAITDLNAEYLQQQRILSRFQDLVRRREMEAESRGGAPQPLPSSLTRALANITSIPSAPLPGSSTSTSASDQRNMSDLIQRARDSAMQTLNLATRLTGLETNSPPATLTGAGQTQATTPLEIIPTSSSGHGAGANGSGTQASTVPATVISVSAPNVTSAPSPGLPLRPSFLEESTLDLGIGASARNLSVGRADEMNSAVDSAAAMSTSELRRELNRRGSTWSSDPMAFTPRRSSRNRIPTAAEIMAQLSDFDSEEDTDIIPME